MESILKRILAWGTFQLIAFSGLLVIIAGVLFIYMTALRYPADMPLIYEDEKATRFSLKTRLKYYTNCKEMFRETYEKYSKHGKTCLIPGIGFRDEIIIPNTSLRWITSQPDSTLSTFEAFLEIDQVKYNGHTKYIVDPWQGLLVRKEMSQVLENIMVALQDELKFAFDARFGTNTEEWTEITLLKTIRLLVGQGSSRFTVGLPLCRDEQYLNDTIAHTDLFVLGAGFVGALPRILRPIIGPFASIPIRYNIWKIKQAFRPLFKQRMQLLANPKSEADPQDHLQMMLRYAQTKCPSELNVDDMTLRLAVANVGSYHQTSIAMTNILFNIIDSDAEYNTINLLRSEVETALALHNNQWTKAAISQMVKADSICRETLRINSFGHRSLIRKVMVGDLRTEDGILLPKGALVSMLAHPAHCDGDVFTDPLKFDPFRFSRLREQPSTATESAAEEVEGGNSKANGANLSFVSTGPQFLPFGHGRRACPGRFLLDFELKMMIAYIVMHYDIGFPAEYNGKRPESEWIAEAIFPPSEGKIRVKRRKTEKA